MPPLEDIVTWDLIEKGAHVLHRRDCGSGSHFMCEHLEEHRATSRLVIESVARQMRQRVVNEYQAEAAWAGAL